MFAMVFKARDCLDLKAQKFGRKPYQFGADITTPLPSHLFLFENDPEGFDHDPHTQTYGEVVGSLNAWRNGLVNAWTMGGHRAHKLRVHAQTPKPCKSMPTSSGNANTVNNNLVGM
jgi:hypothetical protein